MATKKPTKPAAPKMSIMEKGTNVVKAMFSKKAKKC